MAETLVENQICKDCGVEIRPNALFCYHCGAAVEEDSDVEISKHTTKLSPKHLEEKFEEPEAELIAEPKKIGNEKNSLPNLKVKSVKNGKENVKLKSAASLRNKARRVEPKKVEIIWEEHENAPNVWFIGITVLLLVFTIVIYYIAMSLK